ncbi:MAG: hypothetical protein ACTHJW_27355 [Streptosporangiaceae bacterium]
MDEPAFDRWRGENLGRALLLGEKRNDLLTLQEVERYGRENFGDPEYVSLYGLRPAEWYARGVRIAGRTAVECTRDQLADLIGRDIASLAGRAWTSRGCPHAPPHAGPAAGTAPLVLDLFAGSGNTLFWINRHVMARRAVGFERDDTVFALADRNLRLARADVDLIHDSYEHGLPALELPQDGLAIIFVAPPWGDALSAESGLDLRCATPPVTEIIRFTSQVLDTRRLLFTVQVFERVERDSLAEVTALLEWSALTIYNINAAGHNHGVLLGTLGWTPA